MTGGTSIDEEDDMLRNVETGSSASLSLPCEIMCHLHFESLFGKWGYEPANVLSLSSHQNHRIPIDRTEPKAKQHGQDLDSLTGNI